MSIVKNKIAIVTGSTSGIGEGIARLLSENGAKLVINSTKSVEKGQQLARELPNSIYLQGDIAIEEDCKHIIDKTIKHFGQLDILVNNASSIVPRQSSEDITTLSNAIFSKVLNDTVVGTWCITRLAIPYLKKSGDGNIVNISSSAGVDTGSASSIIPYGVSKAAINYLTKYLAKHCGPEIRANAIAPGVIMTPRTQDFDEALNKFKSKSPLKRIGEPKDIAELVLAVIRSNYINGEVILADGGFSVM